VLTEVRTDMLARAILSACAWEMVFCFDLLDVSSGASLLGCLRCQNALNLHLPG
jgi:hypothetical protein